MREKITIKTACQIFIWFLVAFAAIDVTAQSLTASDTFANILGLINLFALLVVSYYTKCFTDWSMFKKKNKEK